MKRIILFFILLNILTSCKNDVENTLINGDWEIDQFYLNEILHKDLMLGFIFKFHDDKSCIIPETKLDWDMYNNKKSTGKWEVEKVNSKEYKLDIITENKILNGKFLLKFWYYKETKVLLMTLEKDSILFINYDYWNQYLPEHNFIKHNTYDYEELGEYMKIKSDMMKKK